MLTKEAKEAFSALGCPYPCVAVRFSYNRPTDASRVEESMSFCQFLRHAQDTDQPFYIQKEDDNCFGKMALGMVPKSPEETSGLAGVAFGIYRSPAPNARIHNALPTLIPGSVQYVTFCPLHCCEFDPDLIICVAETAQAEIIMRATSYISGDLWESKSSYVVSCAWSYVYPYLSGKVNFTITGMHHGMKRRKIYPPGLHVITIPYQKIPEVCTALCEMDFVPLSMREDEESRAELSRRLKELKAFHPQKGV